jgi:predicted aspartyl protease
MKRRYSDEFAPPAPVVPVTVRCPGEPRRSSLLGKLDTGADVCGVPESLIEQLDLPPVRTVRAAGFSGELSEAVVYRIDLEIGALELLRIEALATRRPYVIVGRNALRRFVLRLDGASQMLEMRVAAPRRKARGRSRRR